MSTSSRAANGSERRLTIGKVLAELRADFPDVSASKIRFLEAEGLITPQRTASGYRTFSDADVQRLGYILSAQRDRFWPLKVIGEALDALDRGLTDPGDGVGDFAGDGAEDGVGGATSADARAGAGGGTLVGGRGGAFLTRKPRK